MSMPSNSLEGLASELRIDIDRRLLDGAEACGETDRATCVYAEIFLTGGVSSAVARPSADLP